MKINNQSLNNICQSDGIIAISADHKFTAWVCLLSDTGHKFLFSRNWSEMIF